MTPNSRMIDPLLQCPLEMRHALRTTSKPHLLAEVVPPFSADSTLAAGDPYLECYAVAECKAIDVPGQWLSPRRRTHGQETMARRRKGRRWRISCSS